MSLEHSPTRRQTSAMRGSASPEAALVEPPIADDLMVGAEIIARFLYGRAGKKEVRDVYRNPFGFSFFKHGNAVAALKSTTRAELHEAQRAARTERQQKKAEEMKAREVGKTCRRRTRQTQKQVAAE